MHTVQTVAQNQPIRDAADALVVGAGPTGLACAAALVQRGVRAVVVERGDQVATAWRSRYRALRLNGGRPFSTLPGHRFPRGTPMFPSRDQVVQYLEDYRAQHRLRVHTGTCVTRLDRAAGGWRLTTSRGTLTAPQVIIATGLLARPYLPDGFTSPQSGPPVVHSAHYVDALPYHGRDVLVVGAGSSAMEIAHDLVVLC